MAAIAGPSSQLGDGLGGGGLHNGFLGRVTVLEREIKFLKAKVEQDSRWKTILEEWIMSNFAFDLRGALLKRTQPDLYPNSQATLQKPTLKSSKASAKNSKEKTTTATVTRGGRKKAASPPKRPARKRKKVFEEYSDEDEEDEEVFSNFDDGGFSDCDRDEVDPRDLIITPDAKELRYSRRKVMKTERVASEECSSDYELAYAVPEDDEGSDAAEAPAEIKAISTGIGNTPGRKGRKGEGSNVKGHKVEKPVEEKSSSDSSSDDELSEEFKNSYPRKKMEWNLLSTYPNQEVMLASFPLVRDWAIHTSCRALGKEKKYYYCKMCSKKGPIRLQVRYENPDGEVEILQNNHSHDHDYSKRRFLCEEIKSEIFTLYRAGLKNSTQIIDAIKTSKPDLKVPTAKQVTFLLKATRKLDNKIARKLKKQQADDTFSRKSQIVVPVVPHLPGTGSGSQQHDILSHTSHNSQSYSSPGGMHVGGAVPAAHSGHLQNTHSSYGPGHQGPSATPHNVPANFTYDQQLILQQFSHLSNSQSHHH